MKHPQKGMKRSVLNIRRNHVLGLLAVVSCLLSVRMQGQMTDREFFSVLNQSYPGLESVKSALSLSDTGLAKTELLLYYQYRTSVFYFPLGSGGTTSAADDNVNRYFTVIDIRKYAGSTDGSIDWIVTDPVDNEWHWQFHRMYWLTNYAKVYASTRNEKYSNACVADMLDWARDNTSGYPRTLDTGIRLKNWVEAYQYLIPKYRSAAVTADAHIAILKSLISQCIYLRDNWRSVGNWGASETEGIGVVVAMFPELNLTSTSTWTWWKDLVLSRMEHHLSGDYFPDGVQYETSPSYACLEYRNLYLTYALMSMNSIPISDVLKNLLVKPLEYMMHVHKPDGYLPQLSDTEKREYRDYLEDGADLFFRSDMRFAATKGNEGTPPASTFGAFPYGGLFTMRDTWGTGSTDYAKSKYLIFDMSSNNPSHAHYDILTFEAYANGRTFIRDAGKYTYVSGTWRNYFKGTASHNTLLVDNKDQQSSTSGVAEYYSSLPGYDYVVGSHQAYSGLKVQRSIFFAKPAYWIISDLVTGTGTHTYDLNYHLDPSFVDTVILDQTTHAATTSQFGLYPADSVETFLLSGWVSDKYNVKTAAPVLQQKRSGVPPVAFESVIYPYGTVKPVISVARQPVLNGTERANVSQATCLKITVDGRNDWYFKSNLKDVTMQFGILSCDARSALIGLEANGSITNIQLVDGTVLFKDDSLLFDSQAVNTSISYGTTSIFAQSTDAQYLKIWSPGIDSLVLNGLKVPTRKENGYLMYEKTSSSIAGSYGKTRMQDFCLFQNYPNPFNPSTLIRYSIAKTCNVTLAVYNLLGQRIATLVNEVASPGAYSVQWHGRTDAGIQAASGVYYYTLSAGEFAKTQSMILLK